MTEKTVVKTIELPDGRDWLWYADANVVALAPHLDDEGRERALSEVQAFWRRSCLHLVPDPAETLMTVPLPQPITEPMDIAAMLSVAER